MDGRKRKEVGDGSVTTDKRIKIEDEAMTKSGLTQPLGEMGLKEGPFLTIVGLNVEGLTEGKCNEIRAIVEKSGCNVLAMCETHQSASNPEALIDYDRIFTTLPESEWDLNVVPCPCEGYK